MTGASRGIGLEIASVLASEGMAVAMNARSELIEHEADALRRSGLDVFAYRGDISSRVEVDEMMRQIEEELGPLWLLVNNAGVLHAGPTVELTEEDWDTCFNIDAKGVFLCSQAAIRRMLPRHSGRIVNLSSIAGMIVRTEQIAYCSAKAAVIHFSRCLAVEMAPHGITVNCLCPGMTLTEMLQTTALERGLDLQKMVSLIPAGRMASPKDHARLITYFASEDARHVTGQVVCVDGGQSLYHPLAN